MRNIATDPKFQLKGVPEPMNRVSFAQKCDAYGMHPEDREDIIAYVKDLEERKRSKAYEMAFRLLRDNQIGAILVILDKEFGAF